MKRIIACFVFVFIFMLPANAAKMVIQRPQVANGLRQELISPDGEYLIAYDAGTVSLWRVHSGELLGNLPEFKNEYPLAWSPDGKLLLARKAIDGRITTYIAVVHAMPSGAITQRLYKVFQPDVTIPYFNGKIIRTIDNDVIRTWRVSDGKLLAKFNLQVPEQDRGKSSIKSPFTQHLYFSQNGKFIVSGKRPDIDSCRIWDAGTGKLLHQIKTNNATFERLAISNNGRYLATVSDNFYRIPFDPDNNKSPALVKRTLYIWDLKTRSILHSWPLVGRILRFSSDDKNLYTSDEIEDSGRVYNVQTGEFRKVRVGGNRQSISYNDKYWVNYYQGRLRITSTRTGKVLSMFPQTMAGGKKLAWSTDGTFLAQGPYLLIWNLQKALQVENLSFEINKDKAAQLYWKSKDELLSTFIYPSWWTLDPVGKHFVRSKQLPQPGYNARYNNPLSKHEWTFISPDGRWMLTHDKTSYSTKNDSEQTSFNLYGPSGGTPTHSIEILNKAHLVIPKGKYLPYLTAEWLPDSIHFLVTTIHGIEIWNAQTSSRERLIKAPADFFPDDGNISGTSISMKLLCVSPDGQYLAATSALKRKYYSVGIWDVKTGQLLKIIPASFNQAASFSADSKRIAFTEVTGKYSSAPHIPKIEIWNWRQDKKPLAEIEPTGQVTEYWNEVPAWSPDSKRFAIATNEDIEIYNSMNGKLLAKMVTGIKVSDTGRSQKWINTKIRPFRDPYYPFVRNDWLIWTPQGYFSAPDRGRKRVRWEENGKLIPLDSPRDKELRKKFCNPRMVAKAILG